MSPGLNIEYNHTIIIIISIEHFQWVWHAIRECLPFRTPISIPFWDLHILKLLRPSFPNLSWISQLFAWNIPQFFLNFALRIYKDSLLSLSEILWAENPDSYLPEQPEDPVAMPWSGVGTQAWVRQKPCRIWPNPPPQHRRRARHHRQKSVRFPCRVL